MIDIRNCKMKEMNSNNFIIEYKLKIVWYVENEELCFVFVRVWVIF